MKLFTESKYLKYISDYYGRIACFYFFKTYIVVSDIPSISFIKSNSDKTFEIYHEYDYSNITNIPYLQKSIKFNGNYYKYSKYFVDKFNMLNIRKILPNIHNNIEIFLNYLKISSENDPIGIMIDDAVKIFSFNIIFSNIFEVKCTIDNYSLNPEIIKALNVLLYEKWTIFDNFDEDKQQLFKDSINLLVHQFRHSYVKKRSKDHVSDIFDIFLQIENNEDFLQSILFLTLFEGIKKINHYVHNIIHELVKSLQIQTSIWKSIVNLTNKIRPLEKDKQFFEKFDNNDSLNNFIYEIYRLFPYKEYELYQNPHYDTEILDYYIPKGSIIVLNNLAARSSNKYYNSPEEIILTRHYKDLKPYSEESKNKCPLSDYVQLVFKLLILNLVKFTIMEYNEKEDYYTKTKTEIDKIYERIITFNYNDPIDDTYQTSIINKYYKFKVRDDMKDEVKLFVKEVDFSNDK